MNDSNLSREIRSEIKHTIGEDVDVSLNDAIATLKGYVSTYEHVVEAGFTAAKFHRVFEVVNDLDYPGKTPFVPLPEQSDELQGMHFDVVIGGAGVVGGAIARALSRYNLRIALLEARDDVGTMQTGHCNGLIHPALPTKYGTLKWEMGYKGNEMYTKLSEELGFELKRIGTLVLTETLREAILSPVVIPMARRHRDPTPILLSRKELDKLEPGLAPNIRRGILLRNTGVVSPFEVTVALVENAIENGVSLFLGTSVIGLFIEDGAIRGVRTTRGTLSTGLFINASGLYSDIIAGFANDRFFTIHPRLGETLIFDKLYQPVNNFIGASSLKTNENPHSKGGGLIPTIDGNLQAGPTAVEVPDREDVSVSGDSVKMLIERINEGLSMIKPQEPPIDKSKIITYFAGCRAPTYKEDFIIEPSKKVKGLIHIAGIQSPGLTAAPAIAERVVEIIRDSYKIEEKESFNPYRRKVKVVRSMDNAERQEFVKEHPLYGHIICRCEEVSEGEVVDILHGPIDIRTIDSVKRRLRAGMGRCQGGFCLTRVMEIISREKGIPFEEVRKNGPGSFIVKEKTKEGYEALYHH